MAKFKVCRKCLTEKPLEGFPASELNGHHSYCRDCLKVYMAERRALKPDAEVSRGRYLRYGERNRRHVWAYLDEHPCVDCGENDPVVLQFDHVRGVKLNDVSRMITGGSSLAQIDAEIAKCDVRCANCHIKVTAQRAGWSKLRR
jgi:hypothetical protein